MKPDTGVMRFVCTWKSGGVALLATLMLGTLAGACGGDAEERAAHATAGDPATFWSALRISGDDVESYSTLEEMADKADSVVVGKFTSIGPSRTIQGDAPEDSLTYAKAELEVEKIVTGAAPTEPVTLEFIVPAPPTEVDAHVDQLEATLPDGNLLVFLRAKQGEGEDGLYRVVNSDGLWAPTDRGAVDTPLAEETPAESGQFVNERAGVETIEELADSLEQPSVDRLEQPSP